MKNRKGKKRRRVKEKPAENILYIEPDEAVLNLMEINKVDLSKERKVSFYLYFSSGEKAKMAEIELVHLEFSVECKESNGENEWLCLASKNLVPFSGTLISIRKRLERITGKLGGNFDGWEIEISDEENL